ncbi:MAG TPA: cyclic nucleotide-binding domain-containing protein [bacterium]|nr:cyclic nucleotide-binding domain-containing protein [bacterium]
MAIRREGPPTDFLKEVSLFDGMQDKTLSQVFKLGKVQEFKAGQMIIEEGQEGGNLYIMINGRAEVTKSGKEPGNQKYLADLDRGSIFGEMSVFDNAPYSANVKAKQDCSVHVIKGDDFKKFLKKNPDVAYEVFCTLISLISNRLRRTNLAFSLLEFN